MAARAAAIPEIAPQSTDLLDPLDFASWYARILHYATSATARAAREKQIADSFVPTHWRDTAGDIVGRLSRPSECMPFARLVTPGIPETLTQKGARGFVKREGWHFSESWGAWTGKTVAKLSATLSTPLNQAVLLLKAKALAKPSDVQECAVSINGEKIGLIAFYGGDVECFAIPVPDGLLSMRSEVEIEFRCARLVSVRAFRSGGADERSVGIGVAEIVVVDNSSNDSLRPYMGHVAAQQMIIPGSWVDLTRDSRAKSILLPKFTLEGFWGAIALEHPVSLLLRSPRRIEGPIRVSIQFRAVATAERPLHVTFAVAERSLKTLFVDTADVQTVHLDIPADLAAILPTVVDCICDDVRSPLAIGLGQIAQPFGVGMLAVRIGSPSEGATEIEADVPYDIGRQINFSANLSPGEMPADRFLVPGGWHACEDFGSWIASKQGHLRLRLSPGPEANLRGRLGVIVPEASGRSAGLTIQVNGRVAGRAEQLASGAHEVAFGIKPDWIGNDGLLAISFVCDASFTPAAISDSLDTRDIGIGIARLTIEPSDGRPGELRPVLQQPLALLPRAIDARLPSKWSSDNTGRLAPEAAVWSIVVGQDSSDVAVSPVGDWLPGPTDALNVGEFSSVLVVLPALSPRIPKDYVAPLPIRYTLEIEGSAVAPSSDVSPTALVVTVGGHRLGAIVRRTPGSFVGRLDWASSVAPSGELFAFGFGGVQSSREQGAPRDAGLPLFAISGIRLLAQFAE